MLLGHSRGAYSHNSARTSDDGHFDTIPIVSTDSPSKGVVTRLIREANDKVIKWRIETKTGVCASALMEAKTKDQAGQDERDQVYERAYGKLYM